MLEGVQHLFQWQTDWVLCRSTTEALKHEKYLYLAQAGPYSGPEPHRVLLWSYAGRYDGRRARLVISDVKADSPLPLFHLAFTDLERNEIYVGTHQENGPHAHIMTDVVLKQQGGSDAVNWRRLHLHTWDISYLSGVSIWNGIEFGMSFERL